MQVTTTATPGRVTSVDGTEIAYERRGRGPAVILIDGAGCYRAFGPLEPLAARLASVLTVYTYDRRGRGDSGDADVYDTACEIEDLAALISEAGGSTALYGVSTGALLALQAAADCGIAVTKLALLEPPLGVPSEVVVAGTRQGPFWPPPEAVAHTLVYDLTIAAETSVDLVRKVTVPTLVIDSVGSSGELTDRARVVADALPDGSHRSLHGRWHDVSAETLAPVLTEFLRD